MATLDWIQNQSDLDLYVKNVTDNGVCYYGAKNIVGLSLNYDAYPECAPSPLPPEITQGIFNSDHEFSFWYNQFADCTAETPAFQKTVIVNNIGATDIIVIANGVSTIVPPGNTLLALTDFAYAGYNTDRQTQFAGGTPLIVLCLPKSSGSSAASAVSSEVSASLLSSIASSPSAVSAKSSAASSSGVSASSSSSKPSGVQATLCCPNVNLPFVLYATITGDGICNGVYALTDTGSPNGIWKSPFADLGTCSGALTAVITLACTQVLPPSGPYGWVLTTAGSATSYQQNSFNCDPLDIVFNGVDLSNCGCGVGATVRITE